VPHKLFSIFTISHRQRTRVKNNPVWVESDTFSRVLIIADTYILIRSHIQRNSKDESIGGDWTQVEINIVEDYARAYLTIMKKQVHEELHHYLEQYTVPL
jgi:hypothetical protein